ncbi:MAG: CoA pyrophosphatase [Candidatus Binatia bacterium]
MSNTKNFKILRNRTPKTLKGNHFRPAAVLVPIQRRTDGDYLVLTQRAETLQHHSGQVAFPGGQVDATDSGPLETALRESQEEIGINPEDVCILGQLDQVDAAYNFLVTPFVGLIPFPYRYRLNLRETSAVFSVPVSALLDLNAVSVDTRLFAKRGLLYRFEYQDWEIWGATARILEQLLRLVYGFRAHEGLS